VTSRSGRSPERPTWPMGDYTPSKQDGSASACYKAILFPARHPRVFPTRLTSETEMERNLDGRRMNALYECDGMNLCTRKYHNKQKGFLPPTFFFMRKREVGEGGFSPPN
jgi:hypothetical protein